LGAAGLLLFVGPGGERIRLVPPLLLPGHRQASGRRAPARLGRRARPDAALRRGLEASGRRRGRGSRPGAASRYREPGALGAFRLGSRGSAPGGVVIEISEKEVVGDYPSFRDILDTLRGARLKIAIDDAGSGYSGLETILYLRPDYIKVADSLVRNLETDPIKREIIASLASIGRRIQATLIAEGIEREEERRALLALEIEYGQGFLLGRPSFQVLPRRKNGSLPPSPGGRGTG
jgi:hypothetical protein